MQIKIFAQVMKVYRGSEQRLLISDIYYREFFYYSSDLEVMISLVSALQH